MKRIRVTIIAKAPLAIAQEKTGGSISDVANYIPGTVLRGSLAGLMLRQAQAEGQDFANNPASDFNRLFIENQAIFQNAYPAIAEVPDPAPDDKHRKKLIVQSGIRVMPSTALSAKNNGGFKSYNPDDPTKPNGNGVFDTLIDRFCADAYNRIYDPNCPKDGERVDAFKGLYSIDNGLYYSHSASTRLLTRVGINRRRATAEDKVLYSVQVLNETKLLSEAVQQEEMTFVGHVWVQDDLADALSSYLAAQNGQVRLGGSASRGLGKVELMPEPLDPPSDLSDRITTFNQTLKNRWERWQIFGDSPSKSISDPDRCFFTLDLQSDAILTEDWQRTMVISAAMLKHVVELDSGDLQLHQSYSSYGQRSGWNNAWGLPKDMELTTDRGSVYLFSIDETDCETWVPKLEELEIWGIGNATAEGFGQIRVCDEFHNVLRENAK